MSPSGEKNAPDQRSSISSFSMEKRLTSFISWLASVNQEVMPLVCSNNRCSGDMARRRSSATDHCQAWPDSRRNSSSWFFVHRVARTQAPSGLCPISSVNIPALRYAAVRPLSTSKKKTPFIQSMLSPGSNVRCSKASGAGSTSSASDAGIGTAVEVGVGEAVGSAMGVSTGVAVGVGVVVGVGVDVGVGATVGVAVGVGVGVAMGVGDGPAVSVGATVAVAGGVIVGVGAGAASEAQASASSATSASVATHALRPMSRA